ncbi:hypothetical protein POTOM_032631 [Populus tomentosa]|uniref:Uncharacterized protein n=1 Tax=Populus tomentosa TaxID=118781 RepID=A0A8X8CPZ1_POPTO|nr:hypothetical protein POTOM_032631 [Populus tomentosa]
MITENSVDKNTPYLSKPLSHKASPFICNMLPFKPKMSRLTFTIHLLLALLLLLASQQHFPSIIKVQAMEAGKQHPSSPLIIIFINYTLSESYSDSAPFSVTISNGWHYHASAATVHFKLKPRQLTSKLHVGDDLPNWVAEKRIHKSSSGPNPVGNRNPPSKQ